MRTRRALLIIFFALVLVFFLGLYHQRRNRPEGLNKGQPANGMETPRTGGAEAPGAPTEPNKADGPTTQPGQKSEPLTKQEEIRRGLKGLNHVDIVFYGKVEDQFGKPLPDTPVAFSIQYRDGFKAGILTNAARTDGQGYFTISGCKGESLSAIPQKPGYVLASTNAGGIYSYMWPEEQRVRTPDPANPVVITMWKLQGAEELVDLERDYRVRFEMSSFGIDFIEGKIVEEGGDLRIEVSRRNPSEGGPKFPWDVRITAVSGGLMEVPTQAYHMTFEAPKEGYINEILESQAERMEGFTKVLFIKSRNGQVFSKAVLSFWVDPAVQGDTRITLRGFANPHGSRNWELEPAKVKKPGAP